jgi:NAD(P)-dependent dehydrogenase (short-subunit alcohol dehydrogenase family)
MESLDGKVAVITGGASGIGLGMAMAFGKAGMKLVIADIEAGPAEAAVAELRAQGFEATSVVTDVRKLDSVQNLASAAYDRHGAVHVLCNNAGVMAWHHAADSVHADWEFTIGVNLWGVIHGVEAFLPRMLAQDGEAHIVNTASIAGVIPSAISAVYSTTKYAVVGLSETMSQELEGTGVSVSVLCPGAVATNIGNSDRNRPDGWTPTRERPQRRGLGSNVSALQPVEAGQMVVDAIRRKQLHIFTEPTLRTPVEARQQRLLEGFTAMEQTPSGRQWNRASGDRRPTTR